ncbi:hypothetical protein DBV14_09580 [Variovorax sp. KBW07]|nr:hypothetical protein DBV14_09580 [Variovorax sp. KBW07]
MSEEQAKNHYLELASEHVKKVQELISTLYQAKQTDPEVLHALQNLANATENLTTVMKLWNPRMSR